MHGYAITLHIEQISQEILRLEEGSLYSALHRMTQAAVLQLLRIQCWRGVEVIKPRPVEFKWRQFEPQFILMAVGWSLRFSLSYRDVEELLLEHGLSADHVTV
jgi:hypothetical protein